MSAQVLAAGGRRRLFAIASALLLGGGLGHGLLAEAADAAKEKGKKVRVMTRNVYLGADLTPALQASGTGELIDRAGEIANQVDRTNFPFRSQALAQEILSKNPDLVGLQEVALWRTGPTNFGVVGTGPTATEVEYDFLQLLLAQLNKNGQTYVPVVVKEEFDFEVPVNDDGQGSGVSGADHNERLTMRDVILARVGSGVKTSNPTSGTFEVLLRVSAAGGLISINVTRGWTALDARVRGSKRFRFVNTHLEAFDSGSNNQGSDGTTYGRGDIRAAQARDLFATGGPAIGRVILLGDINSDDDTVQDNGDRNAYLALLSGGFSERSTANPLSCCLTDPELVGGSLADFNHQVDHVLTNTRKIKLVNSSVTGLAPVGGLWPSDHAGVFSTLRIPRKTK
jgi:endonuclease/exonuclease/phosphatase family metal-dependent hydrolase